MAKSFHGNFANKGKIPQNKFHFQKRGFLCFETSDTTENKFETQTFGIFKVFQSLEVSETCYFSVQNAKFKLGALENASYSHMNIKS